MSKNNGPLVDEQFIANVIAYLALDATTKLPHPLTDEIRTDLQYKIDAHMGLA